MARTRLNPAETQTTTVGDIITAATGNTITAANFETYGKVATLSVTFSRDSAINDGAQITLGTLTSAKKPKVGATVGSARFVGHISSGGVVYLRNVQGSQLAANTSITVYATFIQ